MISRIRGTILESTPLQVIVDAGGLGYEVHIPITTAEKLPGIGKECALFTHAVYREDAQTLYGFATRQDRDFFRLLVEKVSGIGPKIAVTILSRMPVESLQHAISQGDVALLSKCPGIGKKTAERVIIELKDKINNALGSSGGDSVAPGSIGGQSGGMAPSAFQDAVASLVILGYKPVDADKMARKAQVALGTDAPTEAIIRKALG